jgi:hypothetical protein
VEVEQCRGENESSISTALNWEHPEHGQFFLLGGLLGATDLWIRKVYCTHGWIPVKVYLQKKMLGAMVADLSPRT